MSIATREAAVDLAEHLVGLDADAVEVEPPDGVRREQLEALTREALALARDGERRDPLRAPVGGSREHAVDVGLGRVRDPGLRAGQAEAVPLALRLQARFAASEPASGSLSAKAATASPRESRGIHSSRTAGRPG